MRIEKSWVFPKGVVPVLRMLNIIFVTLKQRYGKPFMRPGATTGTLRREYEKSFFGVLCLITFHWSFKKINFLVKFLTKLWLLQCLETRYQKKNRLIE